MAHNHEVRDGLHVYKLSMDFGLSTRMDKTHRVQVDLKKEGGHGR